MVVDGSDVYPSVGKTAFSCPFCGAYTTQYWYAVYAKRNSDNELPFVPYARPDSDYSDDEVNLKLKEMWQTWVRDYEKGRILLRKETQSLHVYEAGNINFSACYSCNEVSVWIYDKLIFPAIRTGPLPNKDLPNDIKVDYEEARSILDISPRGAAALLRLSIQKLCNHLKAGSDLNTAIAELRKRGLKQKVVDALDIVRVIGNEAVHPGTIDLNDSRDIAEALFGLVNIIAEEMISEDKHINVLYSRLPEPKRKQIEQRDKSKDI